MIDISNLTLGQLEELEDIVHIRIECLKNEIPEIKIGDCFLYISTKETYVCFSKVINIDSPLYEIVFIAYDTEVSPEYCIDKGNATVPKTYFSDCTRVTLEVYEKAEQLEFNFKEQLNNIIKQLKFSLKDIING